MTSEEKQEALNLAAKRCFDAAHIGSPRIHIMRPSQQDLIERVIREHAEWMAFESRSPSDQPHGW